MSRTNGGLAVLACVASSLSAIAVTPVARWDFDEGRGTTLRDSAGTSHGLIHGGDWVRCGKGFALRFDGLDDYVDCGKPDALDLRGPFALEAWVHPDRMPTAEPGIVGKYFETYAVTYYRTGSAHLYVSGGGNHVYGSLPIGRWSHIVGAYDGRMLRFYLNGREAGAKQSLEAVVKRGGRFMIGCIIGESANTDEALRNTAYFAGMVDAVRVYDRALTSREIIESYNAEAAEKEQPVIDVARLDRLGLRLFPYPEQSQIVARVDYAPLKPLPAGAKVLVELTGPGLPEAGRAVTLDPDAPRDMLEATLSIADTREGEYEICAAVIDGSQRRYENREVLTLPLVQSGIPSPQEHEMAGLPLSLRPPTYKVQIAAGGGLHVSFDGHSFPVESSFSFAGGGENLLSVADESAGGMEPGWKVASRQIGDNGYEITAEGAFYSVRRRLRCDPTRIVVEDTFTNRSDDVCGIILSNHVDTRRLAGASAIAQPNATVHVSTKDAGVGLLAMDDLYHVHCENTTADGVAALRDRHFGLDKGASCMLTWAIYPVSSPDYYDFINQIRKDEGLHGRVEGSLLFTSSWNVAPATEVQNKAVGYLSGASLTRVLQNPTISLEGWEFLEYPDVCRRIKEFISANKRQYPDVKVTFHVAHSLYATNRPRELFPDSLVVDEQGRADCYGPNTVEYYGSYFSKELIDDGWRWWLYYPTMDNRFGKVMLEATDYMIHELGADAIWADGFIEGYIKSGYTYDCWDGHSVDIDPATKKVVRKKGNVTYLALPVLKEVVRRFGEAGGVVMTNGRSGPLSFVKMEPVISCNETGGGDQQPIAGMHLGRTVTPLGNQTFIQSPLDVYPDILAKLELGALYFWYGERDFVTEPTIVSHMYPITFESIHPGVVRGRERVVSRRSGVYGWPGDRALHAVYYYDGRGRQRPNGHPTCIDAEGVRTELSLGEDEAAVVERLAVTAKASAPVHLVMDQWDARGLVARLNGRADLEFAFKRGAFTWMEPGRIRVRVGERTIETRAADEGSSFNLHIDGPVALTVDAASP